MTSSTLMRIWLAAAAILLLLSAAVVAQPPAAPYLNAAPPPGMARIWFFRDLNPNETLAMAYIRLNGTLPASPKLAAPSTATLRRAAITSASIAMSRICTMKRMSCSRPGRRPMPECYHLTTSCRAAAAEGAAAEVKGAAS